MLLPAALADDDDPQCDLTGDCAVDLSDLARLLSEYGAVGDCAWEPDGDTVALWRLNDSGEDFSGNGNDLAIKKDQIGWVDDAPHCRGVMMGEDGYPGDCHLAEGGALTAPGSGCTYPGSGDWTVEAWVYFPSADASYSIVYHYSEHVAGHDPYQLGINGGVAFFEINNSVVVTADVSEYTKQWFHLAAVYRYEQDAAICVNGERLAVEPTTDVPEYLPDYHVYLGGNYCGTALGLKIDEVRISSRARCPREWVLDGTLPEPIAYHGVGALDNGILVFGGHPRQDRAYLYTPGGGWDDDGIADMPRARHSMGFSEHQGKIYSIAGYLEGDGYYGRTVEVWSYDPIANSWSEETPLTLHRAQNSAASLGDCVFTMGGHHEDPGHGFSLDLAERFCPGSGDPWQEVASLTTDRSGLGAATVRGKIYAIGGNSHETGGHNITGQWVESFDPDTDTWTIEPNMPTARYQFAAAAVGDRIYAIGGVGVEGAPVDTVEYYDVAEGQWHADTRFPVPAAGLRAVAIGNRIYVLGGSTASSDFLDTVYVLDVGP